MSLLQALEATGATVQADAPLARHAFWRVGGPADFLVDAHDLSQVCRIMALGEPVTLLGRGSNALISDAGIRGIVLRLKGDLAELKVEGLRAEAGAGLYLNVLLARLDRAGLGGAEGFVGIPGTIGGAVVMNAGCALGEAKDVVQQITLVAPGGEVLRVEPTFRYRHADLPEGVVVSATLRLEDTDVAARRERRDAFLARRKATQPLDLPSCGSTFKNPPGDHAARLIEAAGLKGRRIGGAEISEKHANFFLNTGGATASEIWELVQLAREVVRERFGVELEPEVRRLGDWGSEGRGGGFVVP